MLLLLLLLTLLLLRLARALPTPGMSRLQPPTAQHKHAKQIPQHSRVLRCTAVLSASGSPSSSKAVQLREPSANSRTRLTHSSRFSSIRRSVMPPLAMVNVDFASPSLVLGVTLIGCGIALLQVSWGLNQSCRTGKLLQHVTVSWVLCVTAAAPVHMALRTAVLWRGSDKGLLW
jgi:hypothetical protein